MCGVIGHYSKQEKICLTHFNEMRDQMYHRGPDSGDSELLLNDHLAFGHRRLSIIDLSEDGTQPMSNEDGTVWITLNGEIYNFQLLREELISKGHQFMSKTDTEVIVHGYEEWGVDGLLSRIKGMFAFAIFDAKVNKLFLVKDRFGIKPLYYYYDGQDFIFSSEIKSIVKWKGFKKEISIPAIEHFLLYRFIPVPITIWKNVSKIPPATYCCLNLESGDWQTHKYWDVRNQAEIEIDFEEAKERTEDLLKKSVEEHLAADVPIGVFLSGGYDSGAIAAFMSELDYKANSYSIGFENWKGSEHKFAKLVADRYDLNHQELVLNNNLIEKTEELMFYYDEPLGGSSFMPTYEVSKLAVQDVKVVMAGDGGDEIFGGYNWYYSIMEAKSSFVQSLNKKIRPENYKERLIQDYYDRMSWAGYDVSEVDRLLNRSPMKLKDGLAFYRPYFIFDSTLKSLQYCDMNTFMPEVILNKVDRASMANSLEVRVPFLDHELVEFLWSLPTNVYYKKGVKKPLLREIIKHRLPQEILNKPKTGFGAPVNQIQHLLKIYETALVGGELQKSGLINVDLMHEYLAKRQVRKLWPLYILEAWLKKWN